jgi:Flp pilus assembly protein TadG
MNARVRRPGATPAGRRGNRGQALVEFSIALIPFLFLLMGAVDLGRGIYVNNAVAQAAREIARVTVVHPCTGTPGSTAPCTTYSAQTQAVIDTQMGLVPGMTQSSVVIVCTDVSDTVLAAAAVTGRCPSADGGGPGSFYRVTVTVPFSVLTPLLPVPKDFTLSAISHVQIP